MDLQRTQGCHEVLPGQTEGMLHPRVCRTENDKATRGTPFPDLMMSECITEASPLKVNVGGAPCLQPVPRTPRAKGTRSIRSSKVPLHLIFEPLGILLVTLPGKGRLPKGGSLKRFLFLPQHLLKSA